MGFFSKPKADLELIDRAPPRPPVSSSRLVPVKDAAREEHIAEYTRLAATVGVAAPDLGIEAFKAFLHRHDLPVFSLPEVIAYMDKKAAEESEHKSGWQWVPMREKDQRRNLEFGRVASRRAETKIVPATDFYKGPHSIHDWNRQQEVERPASSQPYGHMVPLHALRKVALIEKEHKGDVAFFVSDYALAPAIAYPDPFLMAVVPSPKARIGEGRFILDFWDEPGFGIDKMVK